MRRFLITAVALLGMAALPNVARADLITGELDFAGGVVVDGTSAAWWLSTNPSLTGPNEALITGSSVKDGGVLVPALLPGGKPLFETNLDFTTTTPGTPLNVNMFEFATDTTAPVVDYVLNYITPCADLGAGFQCFGGSPFGFIDNANGVSIVLDMSGTVYDTATPGITNTWTGTWSTQVAGQTALGLLSIIEAGGTITNSYSGTKITASGVPEPATLLTFGFGSLALARYRRRNKKA